MCDTVNGVSLNMHLPQKYSVTACWTTFGRAARHVRKTHSMMLNVGQKTKALLMNQIPTNSNKSVEKRKKDRLVEVGALNSKYSYNKYEWVTKSRGQILILHRNRQFKIKQTQISRQQQTSEEEAKNWGNKFRNCVDVIFIYNGHTHIHTHSMKKQRSRPKAIIKLKRQQQQRNGSETVRCFRRHQQQYIRLNLRTISKLLTHHNTNTSGKWLVKSNNHKNVLNLFLDLPNGRSERKEEG